jgi:uncharacterized protein (TIGR02996 family)
MAKRAKPTPRKPPAKRPGRAKVAPMIDLREPAGRLELLLATWRTHRGSELSALAHRASTIAARGRDAITGTNHLELQASWLAVEAKRDPVDLDRLLATLTAGRCEQAIARLAKLAKRPIDPRTLEKIVVIVEADPKLRRGETSLVPFTSKPNRPFWNDLLALLAEQGDATIVARLRVVAARETETQFEEWLSASLVKMLPTLDGRAPTPLDAAAQDAIAAIAKQIDRDESTAQPSADTGDSLFSAVWAAPDDDAPRHVLADFLSERGDPRGEFIALQLARHGGTLDAAGKKREKELLKRHKKQWLGPIAPLIQPHNMRFERGFLVTCQLEPNAELEKTLGKHPAWSTIREFLVHHYSAAKGTEKQLAALLESHGATRTWNFTRGID